MFQANVIDLDEIHVLSTLFIFVRLTVFKTFYKSGFHEKWRLRIDWQPY